MFEHIEYSVQCLEAGIWVCKVTSRDLAYVEQAMAHYKKIRPGDKYRYAIRTVSDWCEMKQRGD